MLFIINYNYMEIIENTKEVMATIEIKCDYCGQKIKKGNVYNTTILKDENGKYVWENHISCDKIADKLNMFDHVIDEGLTSVEFIDNIEEEFSDLLGCDDEFSFLDKLKIVKEYYKLKHN